MAHINLTGGEASAAAAARRLELFKATARMVAWADVMGPKLRARIRQRAPRGKGPDSGRLADSTRYQRHTSVGRVRMEFTSNVPYAPFVIKGTKPHEIVPRAARMLHWTGAGGESIFARKVHHPGTKANDYPHQALREMLPEMAATFRLTFERL